MLSHHVIVQQIPSLFQYFELQLKQPMVWEILGLGYLIAATGILSYFGIRRIKQSP